MHHSFSSKHHLWKHKILEWQLFRLQKVAIVLSIVRMDVTLPFLCYCAGFSSDL